MHFTKNKEKNNDCITCCNSTIMATDDSCLVNYFKHSITYVHNVFNHLIAPVHNNKREKKRQGQK